MTRSTSPDRRSAIVCVALFCVALASSRAHAQATCGPETRVPFAGHSFPVDAVPVLIDAFPYLTFDQPVSVTTIPGPDRLAVAEHGGRILVFPNDPYAFS